MQFLIAYGGGLSVLTDLWLCGLFTGVFLRPRFWRDYLPRPGMVLWRALSAAERAFREGAESHRPLLPDRYFRFARISAEAPTDGLCRCQTERVKDVALILFRQVCLLRLGARKARVKVEKTTSVWGVKHAEAGDRL